MRLVPEIMDYAELVSALFRLHDCTGATLRSLLRKLAFSSSIIPPHTPLPPLFGCVYASIAPGLQCQTHRPPL